jgi:hypothetical protein
MALNIDDGHQSVYLVDGRKNLHLVDGRQNLHSVDGRQNSYSVNYGHKIAYLVHFLKLLRISYCSR